MVEGVASIVAEILMPLLLGIFEGLVLVLFASVRPWRYALSTSYRMRVNAELAQCSPLAKWWYMLWGSFAILSSIAVVAGIVWVFNAGPDSEQPNSMREAAMRKVSESVKNRVLPASEAQP